MVRKLKPQKLSKEQLQEYIKEQRLEARTELLSDTVCVLAWSLRLKGYGKKRIENYINDFFELMSDVRRGNLLSIDDIRLQLLKECDLNIVDLINKKASEHCNRMLKAGVRL